MNYSKLPHFRWIIFAVMATGLTNRLLVAQSFPPKFQATDAPANSIWLESLDLKNVTTRFGQAQAGKTPDNNSLKIGGVDGIEYDHADLAGALITLAPGATDKLETVLVPKEVPRLKMLETDPKTAIHGARVIGTTPGRFFLFSISATGTAPLTFSAEGLPDGLSSTKRPAPSPACSPRPAPQRLPSLSSVPAARLIAT